MPEVALQVIVFPTSGAPLNVSIAVNVIESPCFKTNVVGLTNRVGMGLIIVQYETPLLDWYRASPAKDAFIVATIEVVVAGAAYMVGTCPRLLVVPLVGLILPEVAVQVMGLFSSPVPFEVSVAVKDSVELDCKVWLGGVSVKVVAFLSAPAWGPAPKR